MTRRAVIVAMIGSVAQKTSGKAEIEPSGKKAPKKILESLFGERVHACVKQVFTPFTMVPNR
jgi:hypothetical protein